MILSQPVQTPSHRRHYSHLYLQLWLPRDLAGPSQALSGQGLNLKGKLYHARPFAAFGSLCLLYELLDDKRPSRMNMRLAKARWGSSLSSFLRLHSKILISVAAATAVWMAYPWPATFVFFEMEHTAMQSWRDPRQESAIDHFTLFHCGSEILNVAVHM